MQHARTHALALVFLFSLGCAEGCGGATLERIGVNLGLGPRTAALEERHAEDGERFDHGRFTRLLERVVDEDGWVDYAALRDDPSELDAYLAEVATADYDALSRDGKLALLINAYNAFTLRLILDHAPLESIKDIPEAERWTAQRWNLGGRTVSLDEIEHQMIRENFRDPRIHFAVNCASVGCPALARAAYEDETLDEDLQRAAERAHTDGTRWFQLDGQRVSLTRLYLWYHQDFEAVAGSELAFASRFNADLAAAAEAGDVDVAYLPYDWSLNSQSANAR
ncbi:MAG: DUF547 domain-containing protein [Sandaracinaceae bacterium]